MNEICPLCNQLDDIRFSCENCNHFLTDLGRITDYLDDYSPYEEINTLKLVDGMLGSVKNRQCLHLFSCPVCQNHSVRAVDETFLN